MIKSESIVKLAVALSSFQAEVQDPAKNSDNPFFKSKYVELDDLLASVRPVLSKHGLVVLQEPSGEDKVLIKTILIHTSGEFIEFEPLTLKPVKNDPQGVGSAITYGRRYSLSSILGVAWDKDDDGNNASGKNSNRSKIDSNQQNKSTHTNTPVQNKKPTEQAHSANEQPSASQLMALGKKAEKAGISPDVMTAITTFKFGNEKLTMTNFSNLFNHLEQYHNEYIESQKKG